MVPANSTSIPLATCPMKKLLNMVVKEFKLDSPSVFNISNIIPDGPLIFHFSYHSLHTTYSTSILWTTPTSLSINVDPHLFSTFISLSVFSIQICFRSFTNLHHVIFIFKTGYPITSRFSLGLCFAILNNSSSTTTGINLFLCLSECPIRLSNPLVSFFTSQYFFLSSSFQLSHPHLCSTTMFKNAWVCPCYKHRLLRLHLQLSLHSNPIFIIVTSIVNLFSKHLFNLRPFQPPQFQFLFELFLSSSLFSEQHIHK